MPHTRGRPRKERITVSLTRDAAAFLKGYRVQVKAPSLSSLLEEIIAQFRRAQQMRKLSASVTAYYDSLSEDERHEESGWAEFAESELARTEL